VFTVWNRKLVLFAGVRVKSTKKEKKRRSEDWQTLSASKNDRTPSSAATLPTFVNRTHSTVHRRGCANVWMLESISLWITQRSPSCPQSNVWMCFLLDEWFLHYRHVSQCSSCLFVRSEGGSVRAAAVRFIVWWRGWSFTEGIHVRTVLMFIMGLKWDADVRLQPRKAQKDGDCDGGREMVYKHRNLPIFPRSGPLLRSRFPLRLAYAMDILSLP